VQLTDHTAVKCTGIDHITVKNATL